MSTQRVSRPATGHAPSVSNSDLPHGRAAEDALYCGLEAARRHGDANGFAPGVLADLESMGQIVEELLPWLRSGEEVDPCEKK